MYLIIIFWMLVKFTPTQIYFQKLILYKSMNKDTAFITPDLIYVIRKNNNNVYCQCSTLYTKYVLKEMYITIPFKEIKDKLKQRKSNKSIRTFYHKMSCNSFN